MKKKDKSLTILLPTDEYDKITEMSEEKDLSKGHIIRQAVKEYLDKNTGQDNLS